MNDKQRGDERRFVISTRNLLVMAINPLLRASTWHVPTNIPTIKVALRDSAILSRGSGAGTDHVSRIIWDGRDNQGRQIQSGIYFCHMENGCYVERNSIVFLNK